MAEFNFETKSEIELQKLLDDQKKIMTSWGVCLPPDDELFQQDCPAWVKVQFFDWIIREGLEA